MPRLDPETGLKVCSNCKIPKTASEFNSNKAQRDKLTGLCKECLKPLKASFSEAHKEEMNLKNNARRRAHPEIRLLASCRWRSRKFNTLARSLSKIFLFPRSARSAGAC